MAVNSYRKLRDGSWGVQVNGSTSPGQTVTVTTKAGKDKIETIEKVLWSGNGVSICAIRPSGRSESQSSSSDRTPYSGTRRTSRGTGQTCAECGRGGHLVADLEDGLMKHHGCCDIPPGGY